MTTMNNNINNNGMMQMNIEFFDDLTCGRTGDDCKCGCFQDSMALRRYWRRPASINDVLASSSSDSTRCELDLTHIRTDSDHKQQQTLYRQNSSTSDLTDEYNQDDDSDDLSEADTIDSMMGMDEEDDWAEPKYCSFDAMSCDSQLSTMADNGVNGVNDSKSSAWTVTCYDHNVNEDGSAVATGGRKLSFSLQLDGSKSVMNLRDDQVVLSVRAIVESDPNATLKAHFDWNDVTMLGDTTDIIELVEDIIKDPKMFDGYNDDDSDCSSRMCTGTFSDSESETSRE